MLVICCLVFCAFAQGQVSAASSDEKDYTIGDDYTEATFLSGYGDAKLLLKKGFDFVNKGSSTINWDLALTGATLSGQVYNDNGAEDLLKDLGYDIVDTTTPNGSKENDIYHPVSSMGYKHYVDENGNEKNIFAVIVRGTVDLFGKDGITDLNDGSYSMFDTSRGNVVGDLKQFIGEATGKSIDELKQEENHFFFSGHSLGGAVANALSVDETVTSLCNGNKEQIYTYTFESPRTCVNLWWIDVEGMSNAYNFKDIDDGVTYLAPYIGGTTYGKNLTFSVNDLDNNVFETVFPDARGGSVTEAPKAENFGDIFGHHDRGLDLVYIIQHGVADGWWDQVHKIDDYISMWAKDKVMVEKDNDENNNADWSSAYYHCIVDNNRQLQTHDRWDTVITINDDTKLALYDFDNNSIPELCIGMIGARGMGLDVFSVFDNEVVYIGRCGAGTFSYTDDNTYPGLFADYNGSYSYEYSPIGYLSIVDRTLDSSPIITYGEYNQQTKNRTTTVNDEALYQAYNGDRKKLEYYLWSDIEANGWKSFLNFYGYHGEQKQSEQQSQNERFDFTLGGNKISIELPSNWHAKTTTSNTGEDITFTVTETNGRDYTVCALRCMNAIEYERVKEWYKSLGSSLEESAEYYGNKGDYYYAMVWSDGYGYDPSTQLVIDKALRISHDVAKTFQFCD